MDLREPISAWTHFAGMVVAIPGTVLLWRRCKSDFGKQVSLLIFGISLIFCYAASAAYHGLRVSEAHIAALNRLDRIGIFVLIAGTYTPLASNLLRGRWRWATLAIAWSIAGVASARLATGGSFPPMLSTGLYLAMGWGSLICYAELARVVSHRALIPLGIGGVCYSLGAILNILHWPSLWSGRFTAHDLFHLFVMAGSLAHFRLMWLIVVPSRQLGHKQSCPPRERDSTRRGG